MRNLKIAITVDPEIPVPPLFYGGIERIVSMLIDEYLKMGHEVILFAHKDSKVNCLLMPYPSTGHDTVSTLKNTIYITKNIIFQKFDIVHSFSRLAYLTCLLPLSLPKVMSYQREPTISQIKKAMSIAKKNTLCFTGCSNYITEKIKPHALAYSVYNGIDLSKYKFEEIISEDAPLVFLGRIEPIKGTHNAILIAQKANKKLLIAGNIPNEYQWYFDEKIKPYLNHQIKYIGPVNDQQKNEILGKALCLVMAIEWNEPFGIVMAEAMACGTPIIATCKGAVNEIVIEGLNGYKSDDVNKLIEHTTIIHGLNRLQIRKQTEKRFSSKVISNEYLKLYQNFISL